MWWGHTEGMRNEAKWRVGKDRRGCLGQVVDSPHQEKKRSWERWWQMCGESAKKKVECGKLDKRTIDVLRICQKRKYVKLDKATKKCLYFVSLPLHSTLVFAFVDICIDNCGSWFEYIVPHTGIFFSFVIKHFTLFPLIFKKAMDACVDRDHGKWGKN